MLRFIVPNNNKQEIVWQRFQIIVLTLWEVMSLSSKGSDIWLSQGVQREVLYKIRVSVLEGGFTRGSVY